MNMLIAVSVAVLAARLVVELSISVVEMIDALAAKFNALDDTAQHAILNAWLLLGYCLIGIIGSLAVSNAYMYWWVLG